MAYKRRLGNKRVRGNTLKLSSSLEGGQMSIEDMKESFDTLVYSAGFDSLNNFSRLQTSTLVVQLDNKHPKKFRIKKVHTEQELAVILSEALVADYIPSSYSTGRNIEKVYDCNMYCTLIRSQNKIEFWGTFPEDKHHDYLTKEQARVVVGCLV